MKVKRMSLLHPSTNSRKYSIIYFWAQKSILIFHIDKKSSYHLSIYDNFYMILNKISLKIKQVAIKTCFRNRGIFYVSFISMINLLLSLHICMQFIDRTFSHKKQKVDKFKHFIEKGSVSLKLWQ